MVCGDELAGILFNAVQSGVLVIDAMTKTIIDVNPAAMFLIGQQYDDIIGNQCDLVLCKNCDLFCKYSAIDDGPALKEIKIERDDGSIKYAEFAVVSRFYKEKHIYIVTLIDITEKKEAELALHEVWNEAKQVLIKNLDNLKTKATIE